MLEILMYLFEHYIIDNALSSKKSLESELKKTLMREGFSLEDIQRALIWLDDLKQGLDSFEKKDSSALSNFRMYLPEEKIKLSVECRGFLLFLEQVGILDVFSREKVIERALALNEFITVGKLKCVTLLVLFNQNNKKTELEFLESWILTEDNTGLH